MNRWKSVATIVGMFDVYIYVARPILMQGTNALSISVSATPPNQLAGSLFLLLGIGIVISFGIVALQKLVK